MRNNIFLSCFLGLMVIAQGAVAKDYRFVTTISSPIERAIPLVADVSPRQASEVQSPRDGVIKEIYAWPGDIVGDGAPLLKIDDTELQEKRRSLNSERSEYTAHLRRIEKLVEKDLVDAALWDKNLQKLAQIRAELAIVEEQLENSIVRAPERGTVIWGDLKVGQKIEGAEPLYWIGDGEQMWLSAYLEEDLSEGLMENDVVAIFPEGSETPVLGLIDFISFGGPKGGNVNLYVNAPRVGEIAMKEKQNILVPIPSRDPHVILPASALTEEGYIYVLGPVGAQTPDQYMTSRFRPHVVREEGGVIYIDNLAENASVLLDPPADIRHRQLLTAFPLEEGWDQTYATVVLKKDNTQVPCAQRNSSGESSGEGGSCGGGGGCGGGAAGGGCGGGGCGAAGGQMAQDSTDPEKQVCLVPAALFVPPQLAEAEDTSGLKDMPEIEPPRPETDTLPFTADPSQLEN